MDVTGMIQHHIDCKRADVHVTRGLSHDLVTCRSCGAESWVDLP